MEVRWWWTSAESREALIPMKYQNNDGGEKKRNVKCISNKYEEDGLQ